MKDLSSFFSKFADKHVVKEPISEDIIETLASIAVASTYVVERYMLNQDCRRSAPGTGRLSVGEEIE